MKKRFCWFNLIAILLIFCSFGAQAQISVQPVSHNICSGSATSFFVTDTGSSNTYRWYVSGMPIDSVPALSALYSGYSTDTLVVSAPTTAMNGWPVYCVINGTVTTDTAYLTVDTLPMAVTGAATVCVGATATYSDASTGGTWTTLYPMVDSISAAGVVTGISAGVDTVYYSLTNSCGTNSSWMAISVIASPTVASISGGTSLCAMSTDTLTDATMGGVWTNMSGMIDSVSAMGVVYGIAAGTDTIKYTVTNACGTAQAVLGISVAAPNYAISGPASVCVGSTISFTSMVAGGTWFVKHTATDTVSGGVVYGKAAGNDTVFYAVTNACGNDTASMAITVLAAPTVSSVLGASSVCAGAAISLSDATAGGVWSHMSSMYDSVSATGVLYGLSAGIDTVYYTVTNACGSAVAKKGITVNTLKPAGTISGSSAVCKGSTIILYETATGGVWSRGNSAVDTIHGVTYGVVKGLSAGTDTIKYSVTNSCGTTVAVFPIRVDTINAGTVTGTDSLCAGTTVMLSDACPGGVWSSSHTTIATVNASGVVTGVGGGADSIIYTVTNSCGTRSSSMIVNVSPLASVGTIYGPTNICKGTTMAVYDSVAGGTWSHHSSSVDSLMSGFMDSVRVMGLAYGVDTISYSATNSCGTQTAKWVVTIDTNVAAPSIMGSMNVCVGASTALMGSPAGGTWMSQSLSIATIDMMGNLMGISTGKDSVFYMYTNSCGSSKAAQVDTVNAQPNTGMISGPSMVCNGSSITLVDTVSGGTWSASNGSGTINTSGIFTTAMPGVDTVYYAVSNAHCTAKAMLSVSVDTIPTAAPITGPNTVCVGSFVMLENANTLGMHTWAVSNGNATISASGSLAGVAAGMDTVMYYFMNGCGGDTAMTVVTVQSPLVGGMIVGPSFVCQGTQITLMDTVSGSGSWISSNPYVASVDGPGLITGRHIGTAVISYTFWNSCGAAVDTMTIQVLGEAAPIVGIDSVGVGKTRLLTDATPGGTWSSSNSTNAMIDSTGLVHGYAIGADTIYYTISNACGTSVSSVVVMIGNPPTAGSIFGPDSLCVGFIGNYGDTAVAGGTWSVKNALGTISSLGQLTGVAGAGYDTVYYSVTNGFGTTKAMKKVYIGSVPVVIVHRYAIISMGGSYPLLDTPNTGTWWSSDPSSIAFAAGYMFVLAPTHNGYDTLVYTVTNACGNTYDTLIYYLPYLKVEQTNATLSEFKVFPNPSNGTFTVNFTSDIEETAHVVVSNMVGQKVQEFDAKSNQLSQVTIEQPDGVYIMTATTESAKFDLKVMIRNNR
jgi:trimeric autotransporter adhesin